jgi:hypothetical protein
MDSHSQTRRVMYYKVRLIENIGQGKRYINVEKFDYDFKSQELYNWCHRVFSEWQEELEVNVY